MSPLMEKSVSRSVGFPFLYFLDYTIMRKNLYTFKMNKTSRLEDSQVVKDAFFIFIINTDLCNHPSKMRFVNARSTEVTSERSPEEASCLKLLRETLLAVNFPAFIFSPPSRVEDNCPNNTTACREMTAPL